MLFRRRPEWQQRLEKRLRYHFSDPALLETALTHRSHAHEQAEEGARTYERLEFLGDAALGFLVSDWLYRDDPTATEGVLTKRRQFVVRTSTLARLAQELGLSAELRLGRGEERTGGRDKPSLMADTFEAVLGAICIDGGIAAARKFVERHLGAVLALTRSTRHAIDDYKTALQEKLQAELRRTPRYRIVSTTGPAHALRFRVEVQVDGDVLGTGSGSNRKRAEQQAAKQALERLRALED